MKQNDLKLLELIKKLTAEAIEEVMDAFAARPLGWVTEHALHAAFVEILNRKLEKKHQYLKYLEEANTGYDLCRVQNEYPTLTKIGRTKRQHWDIAVLHSPNNFNFNIPAIDSFNIGCIVEFGLAAPYENVALDKKQEIKVPHFIDDLHRIYHSSHNPGTILPEAGLYIVECYRILQHGRVTDWRGKSKLPDFLENITEGYPRESWLGESWVRQTDLFFSPEERLKALDKINLYFAIASEDGMGKFKTSLFRLPASESKFHLVKKACLLQWASPRSVDSRGSCLVSRLEGHRAEIAQG